ncbi:zinc-binding dehydrogenase [Microbacterium sp. ASV81]|uniref:Zinc-binding dehydrogenase n=1 Tax=Microbacterium capsulatum TaxID=3041921 RepID=A0ABU0XFM0_9MICO|nr:zinc-binding dehydrogenase [Microbacterium sp. ASV81]MDQ4213499.1 zinc-binding dehydrogenase [Microbacterium sp. ASV81]
MLAATLTGVGAIELTTRARPLRVPGQALIRVEAVGLCGSDLSYFSKGANGDFVVRAPLILGHEVTGTVVELDADPTPASLRVGTRVAVHPAWPSPGPGEDAVSARWRDEPASFLGSASTSPHTDGGLQEYLSVRTEQLRVLPDRLPLRAAVLAEPTAVVLHALSRAGDVRGKDALICGAGPIGLLGLLALRAAGAGRITVSDVRPAALALAQELGADAAVDVSRDSVAVSADLALEASGVPAALEAAVAAARAGGTIVQLGMLPRDPRPVALSGIVTKELSVVGSHRFAGELDAALALLEAMPEAAEIVRTVVPLRHVAAAFAAVADAAIVGKVVVAVADGELA